MTQRAETIQYTLDALAHHLPKDEPRFRMVQQSADQLDEEGVPLQMLVIYQEGNSAVRQSLPMRADEIQYAATDMLNGIMAETHKLQRLIAMHASTLERRLAMEKVIRDWEPK